MREIGAAGGGGDYDMMGFARDLQILAELGGLTTPRLMVYKDWKTYNFNRDISWMSIGDIER